MPIDRITLFCFGASYAVALVLEIIRLVRPGGTVRLLAMMFGSAGLLAHTLYLIGQRISLESQAGTLLFLAWIMTMFYFYGSLHHKKLAWGLFVLPVILALTVLAAWERPATAGSSVAAGYNFASFWRILHIALFVLAAVGVSVASVASAMYIVQARRLKAKTLPGQGMQLLSLERLESMNRRGIIWAFPLLTVGLLVGLVELTQQGDRLQGWTDPRIISTILLWLVFAILLYLRYSLHLRGRRVAWMTIMAFALLLVTLLTSHSSGTGGSP
jgi:ABC-type uncharacterized transport system permease subunit